MKGRELQDSVADHLSDPNSPASQFLLAGHTGGLQNLGKYIETAVRPQVVRRGSLPLVLRRSTPGAGKALTACEALLTMDR
jgi:hypothetical protein